MDDVGGLMKTLLLELSDADPEVRSGAAVRLGERWRDGAADVPATDALLGVLADHDRVYPGIADTFWTTVVYDFHGDRAEIRRWMLKVLEARQGKRELSPVPGNNLEFYAHEEFDDDAKALRSLLRWGYENTVSMALAHAALGREDMVSLLSELASRSDGRYAAEELAISYGLLLPEVVSRWPERVLGGVRVRLLTRDYGTKWRVTWFFPWPNPISLSDEACLSLLANEPLGPALDTHAFAHIPCPTLAQSRVRTLTPRTDAEIRIVTDAEARVVAVRSVRSRAP
jgi:hypothetical protein